MQRSAGHPVFPGAEYASQPEDIRPQASIQAAGKVESIGMFHTGTTASQSTVHRPGGIH